MPWQPRRLRLENLESRRLLAAVHIPDDLTVQVGAQVAAPVMIDSAQGIRGAEIRIQYDPTLLTLTADDVAAGSAWGEAEETQVVANVDQATGTVIVFIATAAGLPDVDGSLVIFAFGVRDAAEPGDETVIDLVEVRLNEGEIPVDPAPVPGPDPTDGLITIVGEPGVSDRIAGFVYADTNNDHLPGPLEGIPGVEITLINVQTNARLQTTTDSSGAFEFTQVPAGSYRLVQTQPLAYLDGGPNELTVQLAAGQNLDNQNFRELGLRAPFVYNRLLTTAALPVGSPAWIEVLEQINVDAASSGTVAAASTTHAANSFSSATVAAESTTVAAESESFVAAAPFSQTALDDHLLAPLEPLAEGESLRPAAAVPQSDRLLAPPPAPWVQDKKNDSYESVDQAIADLGLW